MKLYNLISFPFFLKIVLTIQYKYNSTKKYILKRLFIVIHYTFLGVALKGINYYLYQILSKCCVHVRIVY